MAFEPNRIVGVIPARWGSTRFPGKALAPIAGRPLVVRVWERACQAKRLDAVVVATDDDRIREAIEAVGGEVAMTRPDHPSGTDRVAEAARAAGARVVVNIQGDEPLIDPALIDAVAGALAEDESWDMATAAAPFGAEEDVTSRDAVKVVRGKDGQALYFSRAPIPCERDAATPNPLHFWRHIGIYGYRRDVLDRLVATPPCELEQIEKLEQLRALYLGCRIRVLETSQAGVGVDTPADVARAEAALREAGLT